ncbi:tripartite tricarboxylate transporter substrate binding protein [Ramlibacter sp. G-1-2-2]|uniref:Tripartite tricarboxylate transporter substrate binding protein n=1 Tax=Ramlibacter agri TaxID=2728837 RepID=A0A848HA02_9BURK|nr:tripartite tricarboxylate transporter substrate binding protein [Ramlibacter agri]NML44438.1 tripartite tricarboxylate transporter substrate binding protein [Ramlibacter agri]
MTVRRRVVLAAALMTAFAAHAEDWPTKPVKIIVPFATGGGSDFVARFIANKLQAAFGQAFVVDNRPGAGGNLGVEMGVKSPADGYTLTLVASSYTVNPAVYKLKFDPVTDIAPIVQIAQGPLILCANPGLPAKSVQELVALAKAQPGKVNFASSGTGGIAHAAGELFAQRAGVKLTHIPYKGTGPAMNDTIGGTTQLFFSSAASAIPQIQGGKLRALAVTTAQRVPALPDVPTAQEAGVGNYTVTLWHGLIAPKGTPPAVIEKINAAVNKIMQSKETADVLKGDGMAPAGGSAAQFATIIRSEIDTWQQLSTTVNLKAE